MKNLIGFLLIIGAIGYAAKVGLDKYWMKEYFIESQERVEQMFKKLSHGSPMDKQLAMAYWFRGKPIISTDEIRANMNKWDDFVDEERIDKPRDYDCETVSVTGTIRNFVGFVECLVDDKDLFLQVPYERPIAWDYE